MTDAQRQRLDKRLLSRSFNAAVEHYDTTAVLQQEVGRRLIERLELIRLHPSRILDIGAGTGATTRLLMRQYPRACFSALDLAPAMLHKARRSAPLFHRLRCVCADAESLPFGPASFDLIFSNLAFQWVNNLDRVILEAQRVLRPGGMLLFSSFGPDTLKELRQAWSQVDDYVHVNRFIDMHDVGDALVRARLSGPVMEMEHFTLTYCQVRDLMCELKTLGAGNVALGRNRGLTGIRRLRAVEAGYERWRTHDGHLPATYEVIYGHAWKSESAPQTIDSSGAVRVPVSGLGRRRSRLPPAGH